jgi:hypothetical protein
MRTQSSRTHASLLTIRAVQPPTNQPGRQCEAKPTHQYSRTPPAGKRKTQLGAAKTEDWRCPINTISASSIKRVSPFRAHLETPPQLKKHERKERALAVYNILKDPGHRQA